MVNEKKLEKFNLAIEEIANAKFILADVKIGKLISIMAEDDEIYQLLANVLKGFDFDQQCEKYLLGDVIELPSKPRDILAFCFCLLLQINEKKLPIYDFLHQYFLSDNINKSYEKFVALIVAPIKEIIVQTLIGEGEKDLGPAPKTVAEMLYDICLLLQQECKLYKNCDDAFVILGAMIDACRRNDLRLFQSLKVAFNCSTKNKKFIKFANLKLSEVE